MSTTPKLTLFGMYRYSDVDIFWGVEMPSGTSKDDFIHRLLSVRGELSVLWPDPDAMREHITVWSQNWLPNFTRIYAALTEEYNPLHNYDRHEEYTDAETTERLGSSEASGAIDSESKVSAFNATTYQPDTSTNGTSSSSDTSTEDVNRQLQHTAHLYGNIGVTKSQEMLSDEIAVRVNNRLYDIMGDVFAQELLILIY